MFIHHFTSSFVESGCVPCRGCFGDIKQIVGQSWNKHGRCFPACISLCLHQVIKSQWLQFLPPCPPDYLSPNVTCSGGSSFFMLLKELLSLHMCVVAPESTIQVPLDAADRSCVVTRRWSLVCLDLVGSADCFPWLWVTRNFLQSHLKCPIFP